MQRGERKYNKEFRWSKAEESLKNFLDYPLTVVEAPKGYGKTTTVKHFLQKQPVSTVWIDLNLSLDNEKRFKSHLIQKINEVMEKESELPLPSSNGRPAIEVIYDSKISWQYRLKKPVVIVLDSYNFIQNAEIHRLVEQIILSEPYRIHLIVLTNQKVDFGAINLKVNGLCQIIESSSFILDEQEIQELFCCHGIELSLQEAMEIEDYTEGWISLCMIFIFDFQQTGKLEHTRNEIFFLEALLRQTASPDELKVLYLAGLFQEIHFDEAVAVCQNDQAGILLLNFARKCGLVRYDYYTGYFKIPCAFREYFSHCAHTTGIGKEPFRRAADWNFGKNNKKRAIKYLYQIQDYEAILKWVEDKGESADIIYDLNDYILAFLKLPESLWLRYPKACLLFCIYLRSYRDWRSCLPLIKSLELFCSEPEHSGNPKYEAILSEIYCLLGGCPEIPCKDCENYRQLARVRLPEGSKLYHNMILTQPGLYYDCVTERDAMGYLCKIQWIKSCFQFMSEMTGGYGYEIQFDLMAGYYLNTGRIAEAEEQLELALNVARCKQNYPIYLQIYLKKLSCILYRGDVLAYKQVMHQIEQITQNLSDPYFIKLFQDAKLMLALYSGLVFEKKYEWLEEPFKIVNLSGGEFIYKLLLLTLLGDTVRLKMFCDIFPVQSRLASCKQIKIYRYMFWAVSEERLGKAKCAEDLMKQAVEFAFSDHFIFPFAANYFLIKDILKRIIQQKDFHIGYIAEIMRMGETLVYNARMTFKELYAEETRVYGALTKREWEILQRLSLGESNKEIAALLNVSEGTIKKTLYNAYQKLGINSRAEAVKFVLERQNSHM